MNKRALANMDGIDPAKRFRADVLDLTLGNELSGTRSRRLVENAMLAGASTGNLKELKKAGNNGKAPGNVSRDLTRTAMRRNKWPKPYVVRVRGFNPKTQAQVLFKLHILLPHEILKSLVSLNGSDVLLRSQHAEVAPDVAEHLATVKAALSCDAVLGCGLWVDGVPYSNDRTQSVDIVSMNIVGQTTMRIPLTAFPKNFIAKGQTMDDIMSVLAWSFRHCALGSMPGCRHDGTAFNKTDSHRRKLAQEQIGLRACLAEVRGDWSMLKDVFRFPGWQEKGHICWRCSIKKSNIGDCDRTASWRQECLSHYGFLRRQTEASKTTSTIFGAPFLTVQCFKMDWLHIMDLGCSCEFLGNFFEYLVLNKIPGNTKAQRCGVLFLEIQEYYRHHPVPSKLPTLTLTMIKKDKKPPKLRAKGGEARGLIGFAKMAAEKYLSLADITEGTIRNCAIELARVYDCLHDFSKDTMQEATIRFGLLYKALGEQVGENKYWRLKPKFHLMMEVGRSGVNPKASWTYRDEDFGGTCAKMCKRRGGKHTPVAMSRALLTKFVSQNPLPLLIG